MTARDSVLLPRWQGLVFRQNWQCPPGVGRLDWECIGGELVKELQGAELISSKGNSNLVPRLNHRCLHFMDLYNCAEDRVRSRRKSTEQKLWKENIPEEAYNSTLVQGVHHLLGCE